MPFLTIPKLSLPSPASYKNTLRITLAVQGLSFLFPMQEVASFIPSQETKIPQASGPNTKTQNRSIVVTDSIKNGPHQKNLKKIKKITPLRHSPDFVTTAYTSRVSQLAEGESGHFPADVSSSVGAEDGGRT